MSVRKAAGWALTISLAFNVMLVALILSISKPTPAGVPLKASERIIDALLPGFALWDAVFGGSWHNSMVWFFSSLALNFIIYAGIVFILEVLFMFWRRWQHPANTNSHTLIR
jgi:hypothetical protein